MKLKDLEYISEISHSDQCEIKGGFSANLVKLAVETGAGFFLSKVRQDTTSSISEDVNGTIDMDVVSANVMKGANGAYHGRKRY